MFVAQLVGEGGKAAEADVEDYTEGPDIHRAIVLALAMGLEDFGGDVGGGTAEGGGEGFFADDFGEAKIGKFDVEWVLFGNQDVFGFNVAVYNVAVMLEAG